MCPGVSERVADMPPPTAGRGPPDTDFPERPESGADFSGVLAALRVRARRADGPTLAESVQPPLQPSVQGGFTGAHTAPRTSPHTATHTGAGTGEREHGGGGAGHSRPSWRAMRGAGTPPPEYGGGVPRPQEVARTAKNRLRASLRRFRGFSGARGGSGWFRAATGLLGGATGVRQAGGRCRRRRPWRTSARHRAAWPGRLAPARATARARRWSRCRASGR